MAKEIIRDFSSADRYLYDFHTCTTAKGWAQIDTRQDASYFGASVKPSAAAKSGRPTTPIPRAVAASSASEKRRTK